MSGENQPKARVLGVHHHSPAVELAQPVHGTVVAAHEKPKHNNEDYLMKSKDGNPYLSTTTEGKTVTTVSAEQNGSQTLARTAPKRNLPTP
jgi:hypothetical protein